MGITSRNKRRSDMELSIIEENIIETFVELVLIISSGVGIRVE